MERIISGFPKPIKLIPMLPPQRFQLSGVPLRFQKHIPIHARADGELSGRSFGPKDFIAPGDHVGFRLFRAERGWEQQKSDGHNYSVQHSVLLSIANPV
jgi:hypothetical protein